MEQNITSKNNDIEGNARQRRFRTLSKCIKIHGPQKVIANLKPDKTI